MKVFSVFSLTILLASCHSDVLHQEDSAYVIPITHDDCIREAPMSEIVDTVLYVPLETSAQSVIGQISKLFFRNDRFYILDERTNKILVFSREGDYMQQYYRPGKGPFEYGTLYDMAMDSDHYMYLLTSGRKIIKLSPDLEPVSEMRLSEGRSCFAVADDYIVFENYLVGDRLRFISHNNQDLGTALPDDSGISRDQPFKPFIYFQDKILYLSSDRDTIYEVSPGAVSYRTIIQYERPVPEGFSNPQVVFGGTFNVIPDTYMHGAGLYTESEDFITFYFSYTLGDPRSQYFVVFSKETGKAFVYTQRSLQDVHLGRLAPFFWEVDDTGRFVAIYNPVNIISEMNKRGIQKQGKLDLSTLREDSNPVLALFQFTKF